MRKSLSVTLSTLVFLSMVGCAPRNTVRNNNVNRGYNNTDIIKNTRTTTGINRRANNYKDGVYTGYGDMTTSGRQMAIVTVRNGRIADVDLTTISPNSYTNDNYTTGNNATINTRNITGNNITDINTRTTGINSNTALNRNNITGTTNMTDDPPRTINSTANNTPGIMNRFTRTNTNDRTNYNQNTNNELTSTGNGLTGNLTDNNYAITNNRTNNIVGTITNTADSTIARVRAALTGSIIQNQGYDFDTSNITNNINDTDSLSYVSNWQLAVRRALVKASR